MRTALATSLLAALITMAIAAQQPQQPARGVTPAPPTTQQTKPATAQETQPRPLIVTASGCVAAGPNQTFTMTVPPPEKPATGVATATVVYTLVADGSVDLKSHVDKQVEVVGREAPTQAVTTVTETNRTTTQPAPSRGAAGTAATKPNPTVQTTAQAQIVAKTLRVSSVNVIAGDCGRSK